MPRLIELLEERRAELVVISDRDDLLGKGRPMRLPPDVPEWLSPIVTVVPGQLFALGLALARGNDPDAPRGLSKVTRTH
jgi:glucosamine--fructose-6-phosphate aminotransferase (isomerizing)